MITHHTFYNDIFTMHKPSTTNKFVIGKIKPAYGILIDSLKLPKNAIDVYINGADFQRHYKYAVDIVSLYISDVYTKNGLLNLTKNGLTIFVGEYKKETYVLKGEFILRVINDFIQGKIKLANLDYKQFNSFIIDNTPYWRDSLIEINHTIIVMDGNKLDDYLFLLDRYEVYDANFVTNITMAADVFLF